MTKIVNLLFHRNVLLLLIIITAFFLRFHRAAEIPPALSWDEVSIGYNAFSILQTGKDEHGKFFPLDTFAAYGDYKPPVPIYITVPFIYLFGMNELAVRLPSIVFGTLTVLLTYFLTKNLFTADSRKHSLALITAFVLAVSPWHINISRAGFEANIATFFIVLGVLLVLYCKKQSQLLYLCWLPFVLAIYTFNSARYFVPLLSISLGILLFKTFNKHRVKTMLGILFGIIALLPIIPPLLSPEARLRFVEVDIFSDSGIVQTSNERIAAEGNTLWANIIHNRRVGYARSYVKHYLDHFGPIFLFLRGDGNPKFSIQDVGQFYIIELPLMLLGVFWLLKEHRTSGIFILFWLFAAIIPAATARETPHALRILTTLPTWHIFISYGILSIQKIRILHTIKLVKRSFPYVVGVLYAASIFYYLHNYYFHYAYEYSGEWQYGYKQAIQYIDEHKNTYENIIITDSIGRPYAYVLFYTQYSPEQFLQEKKSRFDAAGFYNVEGFNAYSFVRQSPREFLKNTLYVLPPNSAPENARILSTVTLLNNQPV